MLAIIVTHPIQYQVPLWRKLAEKNNLSFEVWYLSEHAARMSRDKEFRKDFSWDLDMLTGYPHRFIETPRGATPNTPLKLRSAKPFVRLFEEHGVSHVLVMGWQVAAYWQAVWAGSKSGRKVWLRGESNAMAPATRLKSLIKRPLLRAFFSRVDHFLCIGSANRDLYRSYNVPEKRLHMAPYAVDNERFAAQADAIRGQRSEIRRQWGIPNDAFCVLFCGKFIPKKRPLDLIEAAKSLNTQHSTLNPHLLFVGSGELGDEMRAACTVIFDADSAPTPDSRPPTSGTRPPASFAGFLNQTEISRAYVAADVLVLPSDYGETWGLVVNEANASGLGAIMSDRCGCTPDLGGHPGNRSFAFSRIDDLADKLLEAEAHQDEEVAEPPQLSATVEVVTNLFRQGVL